MQSKWTEVKTCKSESYAQIFMNDVLQSIHDSLKVSVASCFSVEDHY